MNKPSRRSVEGCRATKLETDCLTHLPREEQFTGTMDAGLQGVLGDGDSPTLGRPDTPARQDAVYPLLDLPVDMQRLILGSVPLPDLARLACLSKEVRTAYVERVTKRDATVTVLLGSHFTAAFRERLSPAQTTLPRDLVVSPEMDPLLQANPNACVSLVRTFEAKGERYKGFCRGGEADGYGVSEGADGRYEGEWRKGQRHGHGIHMLSNGDEYEGGWRDGQRHGRGSFTDSDGDTYVGDWREGAQHGWGTYTWPDGETYVGEWKEGRQHGHGTNTWIPGGKYEGDWREGVRCGRGTQIETDGTLYEGDWEGDYQHGEGKFIVWNGNVFEGGVCEGVQHGWGTYRWANGDSYVGHFKKGDMHGKGTFTWADGHTVVGEWRDNYRHRWGDALWRYLFGRMDAKAISLCLWASAVILTIEMIVLLPPAIRALNYLGWL